MRSVSIIIRSKNEEEWIALCLKGIAEQNTDRSVEIILVDNDSTDQTVKKALYVWPDLKLVTISEYRPGESLNIGIGAATGDIIVCISSHCVPANNEWLESLCRELDDENVSCVYGRQIPLESTHDQDARDLWVVFGLDRRVQEKDPFFHNANSAFLRRTWVEMPFDGEVTNLEDRVWGQQQINLGRRIVYTPDAAVYHHHGIHQKGDAKRCGGVVGVMKKLHSDHEKYSGFLDPLRHQRSLLVMPISMRYGDHDKNSFIRSIPKLKNEVENFDLLVLPDSEEVKNIAIENGMLCPYVRSHSASEAVPPLIDDLNVLLEHLQEDNQFYDHIALAEMIYPNRRERFFSIMLEKLRQLGADSIIAAWPERRPVMIESTSGVKERYDDFHRSLNDRRPVYIGLPGLGVISKPELIRRGKLFSETSAIYEVDSWSEVQEER